MASRINHERPDSAPMVHRKELGTAYKADLKLTEKRQYPSPPARHSGICRIQTTVHLILKRHGLNRLPSHHRKYERRQHKWKRYEKQQPGHRVQVDVKFLERIPGSKKRLYQYTAIDDCTRMRVLKIYDSCNQGTAIKFINEVISRLP